MPLDVGASATAPPGEPVVAPGNAMGGGYAFGAVHMRARGVYTNTVPTDAYRGAGKPEANYLLERLIDAAAATHNPGGDHTTQLRVRAKLAHLRAPRPLERSSIGAQRPVRVAPTVAGNLARHRRRGPLDAPRDRAGRQAGRDPT